MTNTELATSLELSQFMDCELKIPDPRIIGAARAKETVGTGDSSNTLFYLDNPFVIAGSYTLYKGATEAAATAMTETTHYTLDKDSGDITLTAAGVTLVGTNIIYAAYSYHAYKITDTQAQAALNRAAEELEDRTDNHWTDGTAATPTYAQVTNEKHDGKGKFDRDYFTRNYPLPDVSTTLTADHAAAVTTLNVTSTAGFPSSGYLLIGSEKITYSAKASTTFTCTATTAAHSDADNVFPYIVEISTTESGTAPVWTVLTEDSQFKMDLEDGRMHMYVTDYDLVYYQLQYPPRLIPNRFRVTYLWGNSTIPADIKRCCLMIASKDLLHTAVRKRVTDGRGDFEVSLINIDEEWINRIIDEHTNIMLSNV